MSAASFCDFISGPMRQQCVVDKVNLATGGREKAEGDHGQSRGVAVNSRQAILHSITYKKNGQLVDVTSGVELNT